MKSWTFDQVIGFLNCLRNHDVLYNSSSPNFKNRIMKDAAFKSLEDEAKELGIPIETDIRKEVKSVIDTYRKERKKVIDSEWTGMDADDVYVPRLAWYSEADAFLQQAVTIRARIDNSKAKKARNVGNELPQTEMNTTAEKRNETDELTDAGENVNKDLLLNETQTGSNGTQSEMESEGNTVSEITSEANDTTDSQSTVTTSRKRRKSSKADESVTSTPMSDMLINKVGEIQASASTALAHMLTDKCKKDECDKFGEVIACQLREFANSSKRLRVQIDLQNIVLKHKEEVEEEAMRAQTFYLVETESMLNSGESENHTERTNPAEETD